MRHLNGVYTQNFNRCHRRGGHVFQGWYKAILVEKDSYLLELARYVVLNPVRSGMVNDVVDWSWSSYRAMIGRNKTLGFLQTDWLLSQFSTDRSIAVKKYQNFVRAGIGLPPVWDALKNQIFLGEKDFVGMMQSQPILKSADLSEIPKSQRRSIGKPLEHYVECYQVAKDGMRKAYATGDYTMQQIATAFGVHYSTVSRAINKSRKA